MATMYRKITDGMKRARNVRHKETDFTRSRKINYAKQLEYQVWPDGTLGKIYDTPMLTFDYPYQLVYAFAGFYRLVVSASPFYVKLSGSTWYIFSAGNKVSFQADPAPRPWGAPVYTGPGSFLGAGNKTSLLAMVEYTINDIFADDLVTVEKEANLSPSTHIIAWERVRI